MRYPGETLSIIAEWYTGDVENWRYLAKANPNLQPNHINIGTTIRIPEKVLHTRKRMPRDFVEAVAKRRQTKAAVVAKTSPRSKPSRPKPTYYYHKVRYPGETLSIIAKWYTGDAANWRNLAKTNPDLNPNRIVVGDKIRIPQKLLNTKKTMPRSFVAALSTTRKSKPDPPAPAAVQAAEKPPQSPPPSPAPPETEELELFGPK